MNARDVTVTGFTVDGVANTVQLAINATLLPGDVVEFVYTDPTVADDVNAIQGTDGTDAASFSHSLVVSLPRCYLRGTRILTDRGEATVETLCIGDAAVTRWGGLQPIKWIGRRSFEPGVLDWCGAPVRISAGALGGGLPRRDLWISPGHSMLVGDVLLLANNLVNGVTIAQDLTLERVDYYQIETESHDCVLARGGRGPKPMPMPATCGCSSTTQPTSRRATPTMWPSKSPSCAHRVPSLERHWTRPCALWCSGPRRRLCPALCGPASTWYPKTV